MRKKSNSSLKKSTFMFSFPFVVVIMETEKSCRKGSEVKMIKIRFLQSGLIVPLLFLTLFCGCGPENRPDVPSGDIPSSQTEETTMETDVPFTEDTSQKEDTFPLEIRIKNISGMSFGMFSMIDPITGKQKNLNAIADREILTLESEWPRDVTIMQWALYDTEGTLLVEAKTDITKATYQVQLTFHGEGCIDKIEESFQ